MAAEESEGTPAGPQDRLRLEEQVCFRLYAASNLIARTYRPHLDRLGLTYSQYLVMLVLWEAEPQTVSQLSERLHTDSGTLTPLLKRLEAAGLVLRRRDPADERRVLVALTEGGRSLQEKAARMADQMKRESCITPREVEALRRDLEHLINGLSRQLKNI